MKEKYMTPELLINKFSAENILDDSSGPDPITVDNDNAYSLYSSLSNGRSFEFKK